MTKKKAIIAAAIFVTLAVISVTAWKISSAGKEAENAGQTSEAATEPATDEIIENISGSFDNSDFIGDYEALRKKKRFNSLKVLFNELKNDYLGKIDFEQDLSSLSMKDLLMLRSSIYAVNGLFFKEENLYSYFMDVKNPLIPWYMNYMCFLLDYEEREKGKGFAEKEKDVNLNDAEKAFVERLDGRIAELRNKDMYISKSDYTIGNTAHIVNMHKVKNLNKSYTDKLAQNNFAIVDLDTGHLQLFHVYEQNAYKDMPSFVTTDLFLQAFHMYLSYTLKKLEQEKFAPALEDLTLSLYKASMDLSKSENGELAQMAEYNAAFYAIAYTLLTGKELNIPARYKDSYYEETSRAKAAEEDEQESNFLGGEVMHYTLFKPRGHYTRKPETEAYFKAMIWLQKAYFCRDSSAHLKQSIFTASLLNTAKSENNRSLMDVYASIFEPTALLIGEPNNLSIMDIAEFLKRENIKDMSLALSAENIEKTNQMLAALAKRILIKPKFQMTCPDKINFMPQRYLIDNEVLQELADTSLNAERAFPKGLDVFSAFGSAPASDLLNNFYKEKEKWSKYPEEMDKLQNKFGSFDGWNKSVHNKWIQSLLTLQKRDKSYPAFMKTKAWDYKNLNTSLASWAELKHDFILYADQPMAAEYGGAGYWLPSPDVTVGYVEPNILFWNKLDELVKLTSSTLAKHKLFDEGLKAKSDTLQGFMDFLIEVSKKELAKKTLSIEEYGKIYSIGGAIENFTLSVLDPDITSGLEKYCYRQYDADCFDGWQLVTGPDRSIAVVADIYTRNMPDCPKNGILHVATGKANEIYVVVEINGYLYLTRGATFSYYEFVMPPNTRLTDEEWQKMEENKPTRPAIQKWMQGIIVDNNAKPAIHEVEHSIYCCADSED